MDISFSSFCEILLGGQHFFAVIITITILRRECRKSQQFKKYTKIQITVGNNSNPNTFRNERIYDSSRVNKEFKNYQN
jgi:hypothetical protein